MQESKLRCIVTGYTDYRDNDRMLSLFSAEKGRIDAKARNCRKATSPLLACSQPFAYGEYVLFSYKDKYIVEQAELMESFYSLREDVERFTASSLACSLCHHAVQEEEANGALFTLLYRSLSYLAYGQNDARDMLCYFLIRFLAITGYRPSITHCAQCGRELTGDKQLYFSAEKGGALCMGCGFGERKTAPLPLEAMRRMLLLDEEEMYRVIFKQSLRQELYRLLIEYSLYYYPQVQKIAEQMESLSFPV